MKRNLYLICFLILLIGIMTGCAGAADYEIELINEYHVMKVSSYNIKVYKKDIADVTGKAPTIPIHHEGKDKEFNDESIVNIGQDDRYIIAKTNKNKYYILDTDEEYVLEFESEVDFKTNKKKLNISENIILKDLDEYEKKH